MTTPLLLAAAGLLLGHLVRSRALRQQRQLAARRQRRHERELQWRAMIRAARGEEA